jgi:hypothetical protein
MKRWSVEEFLTEVLKELPDLPVELRERLIDAASNPRANRRREIENLLRGGFRG